MYFQDIVLYAHIFIFYYYQYCSLFFSFLTPVVVCIYICVWHDLVTKQQKCTYTQRYIYMYTYIYVCVSHSVMPDSLPPHGLQPARFLCPWDFPGKDTGVCDFLLQGIFLTQGLNPGLLHHRQILYQLSYTHTHTHTHTHIKCNVDIVVGEDSWESLGLQGDPTSPS